ncbi:endonuclease VII domain-containing protein [Streptomyces sp. G3]|uniref:endonuclease VII domain-containing protein n=1 Tax=Streptomyces sp. G3 TaxID=690144 RepID=UPI002030A189|nr:endonuclease VII domain-containing protein [Streptomyces sp. G3]MCM1943144.1 endonuclease VII domain-containing protein [Streptomyces sp. G3]
MTEVTPACARPTKRRRNGSTGTPTGYRAHRAARDATCEPCMEAWRKHQAERKANLSPARLKAERARTAELARLRNAATYACTVAVPGRPDGVQGTVDGYVAHIKADSVPCQPCRDAAAAHDFGPVCARPTRRHPEGRTGTRQGYHAHVYAGEPACDMCLKASAAFQKGERSKDPEMALRHSLWSKYRMTLDDYRSLLAAQGGKCAVCGVDSPTDFRTRRFHVDHDHSCCPTTKKSCGQCVRGLLCHACNTGLGNFQDNPERLLAAVAYLTARKGAKPDAVH